MDGAHQHLAAPSVMDGVAVAREVSEWSAENGELPSLTPPSLPEIEQVGLATNRRTDDVVDGEPNQ